MVGGVKRKKEGSTYEGGGQKTIFAGTLSAICYKKRKTPLPLHQQYKTRQT